jgi:hypothetical protein
MLTYGGVRRNRNDVNGAIAWKSLPAGVPSRTGAVIRITNKLDRRPMLLVSPVSLPTRVFFPGTTTTANNEPG